MNPMMCRPLILLSLTMMINKPKLSKGMTCSMDRSDDLFSAEEPNDESYHENSIGDQMNLDTF